MTQHPDYTADDLSILSVGQWNPGDSEESEPVAEETAPPANPWEEAEDAVSYARNQTKPAVEEAPTGPAAEEISRVELIPGGVKSAIEAILAVADQPVSVREFAATLMVTENHIERALDELYREYNGYLDGDSSGEPRGFELRRMATGWRLFARQDFAPWVSRFVVGNSTTKLSKAALETLTVICYQQPATKSYVASVRGTSVDAAFRTLLQHGLIVETVPDPETGSKQYVTTDKLLEKLGIGSLDELPALAPFLPDTDDLELSADTP